MENRTITLWAYNLETILSEKLQTILSRGILNTRMRDFYDIRILLSVYDKFIDVDMLKKAFEVTCKKRDTEILQIDGSKIIKNISGDAQLQILWKSYQSKYSYASNIKYEEVIESLKKLWSKIS